MSGAKSVGAFIVRLVFGDEDQQARKLAYGQHEVTRSPGPNFLCKRGTPSGPGAPRSRSFTVSSKASTTGGS